MGLAVGIDLGTSNTVVAAVRDGRAVTLTDETGSRLIPSIVSFHPNGNVLVGESARERRLIDPTNTVYSVKRLIGRSWASEEVQQARGRFPFELREGAKNSTLVVARGETYALPEMSAFVLRRAKAIAEAALGETVDRAVITVPANFNDLQRASTKVAGKLAGLDVLRILNEPTAAALAYGQTTNKNERLAVYDLGGGTFDITLLDLSGNVFEVLATAGDTALGGDDIDLVIADIMADQIVRTHRFDPRVDVVEFAKLRIYAEKLKLLLSTQAEATIEISDVGAGEGGTRVSIAFTMTRERLEQETGAMIDRTLDVCRFAIETVNLQVENLDRVILVGGPTRMPLVQRKARDFFRNEPALKVNPDEVVALGAAIQAHVLDRGRGKKGGRTVPVIVETIPPPPPAPPPSARVPRISAQGAPAAVANPPEPSEKLDPLSSAGPVRARAPTLLGIPPPGPSVPSRIVALGGGILPAANPAPPSRRPSVPDANEVLELPKADLPKGDGISFSRGAPQLMFGDDAAPRTQRPPDPVFDHTPSPATKRTPTLAEQFAAAPSVPPPPLAAAPVLPSALPPVPARAPVSLPPAAPRMAAPLLIDVTPLSLRVETVGGFCDVLIAANTAVPCDRTRVFLTAADGQTTVIVRVAQGESHRFTENTYLGELELTGLTPAPRGETQIAVTFEIDADGILNVKAKDVKSARQTQARLQLLGAQTDPKDVEAMMKRQARHTVH